MLVLTKQDRLMHVIHATSDPFYMHWLRKSRPLSPPLPIQAVAQSAYLRTHRSIQHHATLPNTVDRRLLKVRSKNIL